MSKKFLYNVNKQKHPEDDVHIAIADYLIQSLLPKVVWTTIEISNQSKNAKAQARLKRKGAMAGWPDIQIFWNDGGLKGLCIEVKSKTGRTQNNQKLVHALLKDIDIPTEVVNDAKLIKGILEKYNVPHRTVHIF